MSPFKIILTSVFAVFIIVGIAVFALSKSSSLTSGSSNLVVWGTIPTESFDKALYESSISGSRDISVTYIKKDVSTFDAEFVEAVADGVGPDIVIFREDSLYKHRNRVFPIPYKTFSERNFKDLFIEEGELFLYPEGIMGIPFIIDPMVMYWNRDILANNLVSQTPVYWDEVKSLVPKITKRDSSANILQSTIALGEWRNINHSKEILSMLLLQAGTPIVDRDSQGSFVSVVNSPMGQPVIPGLSAVNFYTAFTNPTSPDYTWNRSLPSSLNFFLSGNSAFYIGFASEIFSIQQKNSNLNFDVTSVPQIRDTSRKTVFGHMYALSIVKQSKQIAGAYTAIMALIEPKALKGLESTTNLPPVRRDLLADKPTDAFRTVFYNSALIARGWMDPNPIQSSTTFRDMIESITSGRTRATEALIRASAELDASLK